MTLHAWDLTCKAPMTLHAWDLACKAPIPSVIELGAGLGAGWRKGWGGSQAAPRQFHIENVMKTNDFGASSQNVEIYVGWELGPELGAELGASTEKQGKAMKSKEKQ